MLQMSAESDDTILNRVTKVMTNVFHLPGNFSVDRTTSSVNVEGWDSLSHATLMMEIEEEFKLELPTDQMFELKNVGELVDLISSEQRCRSKTP